MRYIPLTENFKNNLIMIKKDLSEHHRDKQTLLSGCIKDRLAQSLKTYYKELKDSYMYLERKDELKLAKTINKL